MGPCSLSVPISSERHCRVAIRRQHGTVKPPPGTRTRATPLEKIERDEAGPLPVAVMRWSGPAKATSEILVARRDRRGVWQRSVRCDVPASRFETRIRVFRSRTLPRMPAASSRLIGAETPHGDEAALREAGEDRLAFRVGVQQHDAARESRHGREPFRGFDCHPEANRRSQTEGRKMTRGVFRTIERPGAESTG